MIRRPPRSTLDRSSAASDVYKRQSQRDDGHYYYLFPLDKYASIDKMQEIFGAAIEKIGKDKWSKFMVENESSMITHKDFIAKWSADYSYVPKKPRIKPEDATFIPVYYTHLTLPTSDLV